MQRGMNPKKGVPTATDLSLNLASYSGAYILPLFRKLIAKFTPPPGIATTGVLFFTIRDNIGHFFKNTILNWYASCRKFTRQLSTLSVLFPRRFLHFSGSYPTHFHTGGWTWKLSASFSRTY